MIDNQSEKRVIFTASVSGNKAIGGDFFRLRLELDSCATEAFKDIKPGQFAQLDLSTLALPRAEQIPEELSDKAGRGIILRRPFSFADVKYAGNKVTVEILYCVLGPGTLRIKTLKPVDTINMIGPLGNGFEIPRDKKLAILAAGGMGSPPLEHLAKELQNHCPKTEVIVFAGAKSVSQLPYLDIKLDKISKEPDFVINEFVQYNAKSLISTDDGSAGFKGFVTDMLKNWLKDNKPAGSDTIIYTCGPEVMMSSVAAISAEYDIPCQVSLERMMACGTGLCQGCAVKYIDKKTKETGYKLCCKDGPVFWADEVVW
ncbi:MAG: dihydroorotate dehydrogenase electron transfer subunit [Sedimentisphaerales bacterium]|nr:dihydroorotate dehydrogenase electron transfer subunit [Sedimentisphaerales bacterium]